MTVRRTDMAADGGATAAADTELATIGGWAAIAAAVVAIGYSVAFVVLANGTLTSLTLVGGGILTAVALVAAYERIRTGPGGLALLGLVFGIAGTTGAIVHGGYDLANIIHPPTGVPDASLPFPVDPRGLLTFGISGLGILALSAAALRNATLPRALAQLGLVLGVLLVVIYLGRLIVFDPKSILILAPAGLAGLIVSPLWYAWVGRELLRASRA